jgi:hypothetical protein
MATTQVRPSSPTLSDRPSLNFLVLDFFNGWDKGVLRKAVDGCNCDQYGDPSCCVKKGLFSYKPQTCRITASVDEKGPLEITVISFGMLTAVCSDRDIIFLARQKPCSTFRDEGDGFR